METVNPIEAMIQASVVEAVRIAVREEITKALEPIYTMLLGDKGLDPSFYDDYPKQD